MGLLANRKRLNEISESFICAPNVVNAILRLTLGHVFTESQELIFYAKMHLS